MRLVRRNIPDQVSPVEAHARPQRLGGSGTIVKRSWMISNISAISCHRLRVSDTRGHCEGSFERNIETRGQLWSKILDGQRCWIRDKGKRRIIEPASRWWVRNNTDAGKPSHRQRPYTWKRGLEEKVSLAECENSRDSKTKSNGEESEYLRHKSVSSDGQSDSEPETPNVTEPELEPEMLNVTEPEMLNVTEPELEHWNTGHCGHWKQHWGWNCKRNQKRRIKGSHQTQSAETSSMIQRLLLPVSHNQNLWVSILRMYQGLMMMTTAEKSWL